MNTLNKYQVASILNFLVSAEKNMTRALSYDDRACREIWHDSATRDLRYVRERLLEAALGDIAIEAPALAEAAE
jgi:hypothetical protein